MLNFWYENYYGYLVFYSFHMNIVISISIMWYCWKAYYHKADRLKRISHAFLALMWINFYLIFQSIALEGLFEGVTGIILFDQGSDVYRSYLENFVSLNSLNVLLYLVVIIVIYKTKKIFKPIIIGYTVLLFPCFYLLYFKKMNEILFYERINIIVLSILGVIVTRYMYQKRKEIKESIISMEKINIFCCFIPVFGVPLVFIKLLLEGRVKIKELLLLNISYILAYLVLGLIIMVLCLSVNLHFAFYITVPMYFICVPFVMIVTMIAVLNFDKQNKTKLESERSENE